MSVLKIENCYDSHVHWRATGDFSERLDVSGLKDPSDILRLPIPQTNESQAWVLGFGWNFSDELLDQCTKELLDQWCPNHPVALSKSDGHSLWVNTRALEKSKFNSKDFAKDLCPLNTDGSVLGVLKEEARNHILKSMPQASEKVIVRHLMKAQKIFHDQGLTHIRDVHFNKTQWEAAKHLEDSGLLKLAVEAFIFDEGMSFQQKIDFALECRKDQSSQSLLQVKGVKVFLDGSLGSETAALSQPYLSGSGRGLLQFTLDEIYDQIFKAWQQKIEIAFHCIGDEASHLVAFAAQKVKNSGLNGVVHFEHVQVLRDETITLMKDLDCVCHLQPGHWLDDKKWIHQKLPVDLIKNLFPWRRLQEAEVQFYFGSDSPLSQPGVNRIIAAVEDASESGVPRLLGSAETYLSHPNRSWPANTHTEIANGEIRSVIFASESL